MRRRYIEYYANINGRNSLILLDEEDFIKSLRRFCKKYKDDKAFIDYVIKEVTDGEFVREDKVQKETKECKDELLNQRKNVNKIVSKWEDNLKKYKQQQTDIDIKKIIQLRNQAKYSYEYLKAMELKNEDVKEYMSLFVEIMSELLCFTGCTKDTYFEIVDSVENARENIQNCCRNKKNKKILQRLEENEIANFYLSDLEDMIKAKNFEDDISISSDLIDSKLENEIQECIQEANNMISHIEYLSKQRTLTWKEIKNIVDENYSKFLAKEKKLSEKWNNYEQKWEDAFDKMKREKERFELQFEQERMSYKQYEIYWEEIALLKKMFPYIYEISQTDENCSEKWYSEMGQKIRNALQEVTVGNKNTKFMLISHDDEICKQNTSIQSKFIADDICYPGLFYYDKNLNRYDCILAGRTYYK